MKKEFVTLPIEDLIPYENNPRINENAVPDVAESMRQVGNIDPIEVDENNVILSGHTRLLALAQLGETETQVVRVTGLTEEQKRKYRILANKAAEKAEWDFSKLEEELEGLDFDGFDFGFNDPINGENESSNDSKDLSFVSSYQVIVECVNEEEQESVFNMLKADGYECRLSTL